MQLANLVYRPAQQLACLLPCCGTALTLFVLPSLQPQKQAGPSRHSVAHVPPQGVCPPPAVMCAPPAPQAAQQPSIRIKVSAARQKHQLLEVLFQWLSMLSNTTHMGDR